MERTVPCAMCAARHASAIERVRRGVRNLDARREVLRIAAHAGSVAADRIETLDEADLRQDPSLAVRTRLEQQPGDGGAVDGDAGDTAAHHAAAVEQFPGGASVVMTDRQKQPVEA